MAFITKGDSNMKVITLTSFNVSAGKTFISRNLAMSLAFANKRICMVDLDIRKGTLTGLERKGKIGITNFVADPTLTVDDIILPDSICEKVDIIPAGSVAPNPAELLMSERLDALFAELRKRYDYIIADSVPGANGTPYQAAMSGGTYVCKLIPGMTLDRCIAESDRRMYSFKRQRKLEQKQSE